MREIKFRAWDKSYRTLHYAVDMFTLEEPMAAYELGEKSRYIFMQYTGLKDKNGEEIYEGDIVTPASRFSSVNYLVYWDDRVSQFRLCARNDKQFDKTHLLDWATEVIGNIYQNPELVEVKDVRHKG